MMRQIYIKMNKIGMLMKGISHVVDIFFKMTDWDWCVDVSSFYIL